MNQIEHSEEYKQILLQAEVLFNPFEHTNVDARLNLATIICMHRETSYYMLYTRYIYQLVLALWEKSYPNDTAKRWSLDKNDYNKSLCPCSYIDMLGNANFDPNNEYKLDDFEKFNLRKQYNDENKVQNILAERKRKLVYEILNCEDIRIYALYHFRLNKR